MKKMTMAIMAVAVFWAMALPAGANVGNIGLFTGKASVGKSSTACGNDGVATVSGGGLGLPGLAKKEAFYHLGTTVTDSVEGPGTLNVCGHVHPNQTTGIGAACGSSSGDHGKGKATFANGSVLWLNNVGWDDAVGGILPIKGDVTTTSKGAKKAKLTGLVVATGGAACVSKGGTKDGSPGNGAGATSFDVVGTYSTTPNL